MILDNRQVPDIVVSREGLSHHPHNQHPHHNQHHHHNHNNNNNNNNNNIPRQGNGNGSPRHVIGGQNGNGSPRRVYPHPNPHHGSPRHANGLPWQPHYHGSPRHVRAGSVGGGGVSGGSGEGAHGSPSHGYNNNGSPRHSPRHLNRNQGSPRHHPNLHHDGNGNGSPRHLANQHHQQHQHQNANNSPRHHHHHHHPLRTNSTGGSPRHALPTERASPRLIQRVFSFDYGRGSPRHSASLEEPPAHAKDPDHSQRRRQQQQQQTVESSVGNGSSGGRVPSRIPVHVQEKQQQQQNQQQQQQQQQQQHHSQLPQLQNHQQQHVQQQHRHRTNSLDRNSEEPHISSPRKTPLGRRGRSGHPQTNTNVANPSTNVANPNTNPTPARKFSEPDVKVPAGSDFKSVVREYSQLSPRRVNLRNKNQGLFKYGLCRIEVKDKPGQAIHPWRRGLADTGGKWHSADAPKWPPQNETKWGSEEGRLNTQSSKWNGRNRNLTEDGEEEEDEDDDDEEEEWRGGGGGGGGGRGSRTGSWNIECDKSEEENDQVFFSDDTSINTTSTEDPPHHHHHHHHHQHHRYGRRESWPVANANPHTEISTATTTTTTDSSYSSSPNPSSRHSEISRSPKRVISSKTSSLESVAEGRRSRGLSPNFLSSPRRSTASPSSLRTASRNGSLGTLSWGSSENVGRRSALSGEIKGSDGGEWDSGVDSVTSKMVLIKCKDANYLTRIYLDREGIHALKIVGRVGVGGSAPDHVMSEGQPGHAHLLHHQQHDDVTKLSGDASGRDNQSGSVISQATDGEFEHDTADYQWLLDYELPCARYRESYSREVGPASLSSGGRDGSGRVSVLEASRGPLQDLSYETLARNLDANLAEIDMDDFHSEDIHNLLTLPTMCGEFQSAEDGEMFASVSGSMMNKIDLGTSCSPHSSSHCDDEDEDGEYKEEEEEEEEEESCDRRDDEEYSGVSGDLSLYQSGPLFSPLKEPPPLANTTFSVDSLDCDSLHDDLILTCQANKDNYTIAFEGSFVQYSEDSDYHEAESESSGSNHWSTERLEGRASAPAMTHSDQPYTTWSRVGRRASRTPEVPSRAATGQQQAAGAAEDSRTSGQNQTSAKSNSMPNLMRRSLMRRSLEASGGCVKVFDLQNSMRSSQTSKTIAGETNNFSLVKLFMRQKSLSKEAVSLSSSISQDGPCSSSDNQSNVHDSSDWPMNSQSENDMDGSASPVPPPALMRQNGVMYHHHHHHHHHHHNHHQERGFRRRTGSLGHDMAPRGNQQPDFSSPDHSTTTTTTDTLTNNTANSQQQQQQQQQQDGLMNNNNNIITAATHPLDNTGLALTNTMDNVTSFEDSLKETNPCSKPPVTSPIREEPEGMDISMDSRGESKVLLDQSEKETKIMHEVLRLRDNKFNAEKNNLAPTKASQKEKNKNRNNFNSLIGEEHKRSQSPGSAKKAAAVTVAAANNNNKRDGLIGSGMRRRQDSGNSSSGYASNRGSTEKIRRPSDSELSSMSQQKPRPKPRVMKQMSDQCLQTSNLKVSAMVNTSFNVEKKEVYVYYPNYALPDLGFLRDKKYNIDARVFLVPQHYAARPEEVRRAKDSRLRRPFSCSDMEKLKKHGFGHIRDWDSLNFLLPKELKEMLLDETECMETTKPSFCHSPKPVRRPASADYSLQQKCSHELKVSASASSLNSTQPSSGYRGSSTMLNDSEGESGINGEQIDAVEKPPPLPKRSISLPQDERQDSEDPDTPPPRPPLPRGILRKSSSLKDDGGKGGTNKRFSAIESGRGGMREDLLKRRSLQEPMEHMAQRVARETIPEAAPASEPNEAEQEVPQNLPSPMGCSCVNQCTGFCGKGLQKKNLLRVSELPDVSSHEDLTEDDLLRIRSQVSNLLVARGGVGSLLTDAGTTCDLCPKKSVSFAENQCPDGGAAAGEGPGATEEDTRPMLYDAHDKKTLVLSVRAAVEKLVTHFSTGGSQQEKVRLGTSAMTPAVAQLALDKLCPAVYALLSDGLHPSLQSLFGKINNSVWRVIEVTSQISPSTKALNDLVLTLNSEECLSEGPIKFNAFIFGLLNIRSLDSWLCYLRTRESVIQKHYHPEAFLYLANTATKSLYDDLLLSLRPLALLPFNLDLLHEYKALHASLQKMEERLLLHTGSKDSPGERPPSVLDHLHSKETKEFKNAAQQDRVKALMRVLASPELDEHELLHSTLDHTRERSRSPRPRSCYDHVAGEELSPAQRKRWSGVQLGSRLLTAIDKLMLEEAAGTSSEDYTDSLDNPKSGRTGGHRRGSLGPDDDQTTDLRISDVSSRDGDVSERSASEKDTENEKGAKACVETDQDEPEGVRFRRLQLKWEQMAGPEKKASKTQPQQQQQQPQTQQTPPPVPEKAVSPSSGSRSRIPRPVSMTSPQRPFKAFDPTKEKTSPQLKQPPKYVPASPKELPKPAPRRSLKDKASSPAPPEEQTNAARPPSVRSRLAPRPNSIASNMVRASSVPGRVPASTDKSCSPSGRYEGQRRYGGQPRSASHGRRVTPGDTPKLVQTLHHRLATDNGHLSFNRGDILTVVVEVDDRYLLCCHNDRKGLVPRASVIIHEE